MNWHILKNWLLPKKKRKAKRKRTNLFKLTDIQRGMAETKLIPITDTYILSKLEEALKPPTLPEQTGGLGSEE